MHMLTDTRRCLLAGRGVPKVKFDPDLAVFTAGCAFRAGEIFATAPYFEGAWNGGGTPDVSSFGRGTELFDNFYDTFDANQGTIEGIWNPEKDRLATQTNDEYLFYVSSKPPNHLNLIYT